MDDAPDDRRRGGRGRGSRHDPRWCRPRSRDGCGRRFRRRRVGSDRTDDAEQRTRAETRRRNPTSRRFAAPAPPCRDGHRSTPGPGFTEVGVSGGSSPTSPAGSCSCRPSSPVHTVVVVEVALDGAAAIVAVVAVGAVAGAEVPVNTGALIVDAEGDGEYVSRRSWARAGARRRLHSGSARSCAASRACTRATRCGVDAEISWRGRGIGAGRSRARELEDGGTRDHRAGDDESERRRERLDRGLGQRHDEPPVVGLTSHCRARCPRSDRRAQRHLPTTWDALGVRRTRRTTARGASSLAVTTSAVRARRRRARRRDRCDRSSRSRFASRAIRRAISRPRPLPRVARVRRPRESRPGVLHDEVHPAAALARRRPSHGPRSPEACGAARCRRARRSAPPRRGDARRPERIGVPRTARATAAAPRASTSQKAIRSRTTSPRSTPRSSG